MHAPLFRFARLRGPVGSCTSPPIASPLWIHPAAARWRAAWLALAALAALTACGSATTTGPHAAWPDRLQQLLPADVVLLGEQHDAPEHQRLQREVVQWLASRGQLAALVLEMAERGHGTTALSRDATEAQVQAALGWNDDAWPWKAYGPVVMAAVSAGVPVLGGNLPRASVRATMGETAWDLLLPPPALQRQHEAVREGHCGLLPASQIAPMARVQVARDASLARTAREATRPGQTVLLVAGAGHVLRSLGVPMHWPANIRSKVVVAATDPSSEAIKTEADMIFDTPAPPAKDHCADLLRQWNEKGRGATRTTTD